MRQDADRARQHEEPARQRRRKAEFAIDDGRGAVDVERYSFAFAPRDVSLDGLGNLGETPLDDTTRGKVAGQFQQARRAWIYRMEAMAEAGT